MHTEVHGKFPVNSSKHGDWDLMKRLENPVNALGLQITRPRALLFQKEKKCLLKERIVY